MPSVHFLLVELKKVTGNANLRINQLTAYDFVGNPQTNQGTCKVNAISNSSVYNLLATPITISFTYVSDPVNLSDYITRGVLGTFPETPTIADLLGRTFSFVENDAARELFADSPDQLTVTITGNSAEVVAVDTTHYMGSATLT
jgi:hypothetical protein